MIRQASLDDLGGVAELLKKAWAVSGHSTNYNEERGLRSLAIMLKNPDGYAGVIEHDGEIVGVLIAARVPGWWFAGFLVQDQMFYVSPEHRGKGVSLLRDFIDWARGWKSVKQIKMHLNNPNAEEAKRAGRLYERFGFRFVGDGYLMEV